MLNVTNYTANDEVTEFNWDAYVNNEQAEEIHKDLILAIEQDHIANEWGPAKPLKRETYAEYHARR